MNRFRVILDAAPRLGGRRRGARIAGSGLAMAFAITLGALSATAVPSSRTPAPSGHLSMGEPALAAPAESPPASPSPSPGSPPPLPPTSVRLPAFGGGQTGAPADPPRAGSALVIPSVSLQVGVIDYGDCTGDTVMTRSSAVHFLCTPATVAAFVGHNPGVFTPLLRTQPGDQVTYQHDGAADTYVIGAGRRVSPQEAAAYTQDGSYVHMVLATCAEPDSSAYWIFLATPVNSKSAPEGGRAPAPSGGGPKPSPSPSPKPSPSPSPSPGGGGGGLFPIPLPSPPF
jgi:hypothetical protein